MQQLPTMLGPAVHRGKDITPNVRGPNNVGRVVQTDPTLLRYASAIMEQKKCWELLAEKFDRFQTLRNNTQQHPTTCNRVWKRTQHVTSNNVGSCWPTMLRPFARGFIKMPYGKELTFCGYNARKTNYNAYFSAGLLTVRTDYISFLLFFLFNVTFRQ